MTDRAETGLNERRSWSGKKEQNGSPHSAFLCSCFAFILYLSAPFPRLEVYAVITVTERTLSGTKAYAEVSTISPLARDTRAVIHF